MSMLRWLRYCLMRAGVVTPEAVVLDLPTAGVATRALSRVVDLLVQGLLAVVLALGAAQVVRFGVSLVLAGLVVAVTVLLVWPIATEILWRGRSVGRAIFGLRVISADGSPVQPRQSVVRGLLALIDIYFSLGFLAATTAMFSPVSQRLGDMAASTVVIRERRSRAGWAPVVFYPPPGFESYVSTLDVGRLEPDDFALIRSFLLRVGSLSSEARYREALALAEGVRERIRHDLPASVAPETWLICVASAYQWRQGGLLREVALGRAPVAPVWGPPQPVRP
jgi:uncharacterized RDD family membrane protein YckC